MACITLTTDFGLKDFYVGALKGALMSHCPHAVLTDISHNISRGDIQEAAFVMKNACPGFPEGSLHLFLLSDHASPGFRHLFFQDENFFFLGPDNGILSLYEGEELKSSVFGIDFRDRFPSQNLPFFNQIGQLCAKILEGNSQALTTTPVEDYVRKTMIQPVVEENKIRGMVFYLDIHGNAILNISKSFFDKVANGRKFSLLARKERYEPKNNQPVYEVGEGDPAIFFNPTGYLQISIRSGKAVSLLGLKKGDLVQIEFL